MKTIGAVFLLLATSVACNSGGDGRGDVRAPVKISGAIVKGPVDGARVCIYALADGRRGDLLECTTSRPDGSYETQLDYRGPVLIEASGGTYTDEDTGTPQVPLAAPLVSIGEVDENGGVVVATPLSSIAARLAGENCAHSPHNFSVAAAAVREELGLGYVDLARGMPVVSGEAINEYGRALIAVSRILKSGATLDGIVGKSNVAALGESISVCTANEPDISVDLAVPWMPDFASDLPTVIEVTGPAASWRARLPEAGPIGSSSCRVVDNTADRVRISCSTEVALRRVTILAGNSAVNVIDGADDEEPTLTLAGARVAMSGGPLHVDRAASVRIDAGGGGVRTVGITAGRVDIDSAPGAHGRGVRACDVNATGALRLVDQTIWARSIRWNGDTETGYLVAYPYSLRLARSTWRCSEGHLTKESLSYDGSNVYGGQLVLAGQSFGTTGLGGTCGKPGHSSCPTTGGAMMSSGTVTFAVQPASSSTGFQNGNLSLSTGPATGGAITVTGTPAGRE